MYASSENGIGYNPAFLRKVREKQRLAKQEAERAEAREKHLAEQLAKAKARLAYEQRQQQDNAHAHYTEYNVIPLERSSIRDMIKATAIQHGTTYEEIVGPRRSKGLTTIRDACVRAAADARPDLSLVSIGKIFNRDHTSIIHSLKKTKKPGQAR